MPKAQYEAITPEICGDFMQAQPEAYELFESLIHKHSCLQFLLRFLPVKILFRTKPQVKEGRKVLGSTKVYAPKDKLVHPYSALILLDYDFWRVNPEAREPLLFHEMCHLGVSEDEARLVLAPHDVEEFYLVVKYYGDWRKEVQRMKDQLLNHQLNMFESEEQKLTNQIEVKLEV